MKLSNINLGIKLILILLVCALCSSCVEMRGVQPIPTDKQSFIGKWKSDGGISIEIFSKGTANIIRLSPMKYSEQLNINASDPTNFRVYFPKDSMLGLVQPFNIAREYKIDQYPAEHNNQIMMMLNGVMLVKE